MMKSSSTGKDDTKKPSFWENNKKWIKPVGIGVGSLGLIVLMYQLLKPKKGQQATQKMLPPAPMNGVPRKKKRKKNLLSGLKPNKKKGGHGKTAKKGKKKVITLL